MAAPFNAERAPVMANRVLALISRMYNLALAEDVKGITTNPAMRLPKPGGEETSRDRALTPDEVRELWSACEQAPPPPRPGDVPPETPPIPQSRE